MRPLTAETAGPQRTCLGCRKVFDRSQLVRYVCAPDGSLLVDYRGKLPGRGAYTCPKLTCIRQAVSKRQFDRALRVSGLAVTVDALQGQLQSALRDRLVALVGMARKASQIVSGSNLVLAALDDPRRLAAIMLTEDISPGVAGKINAKAHGRGVPCLCFGTKAELGQLLGRSESSVAALLKGRLAEAFLAEWQQYQEISGDF